MQDIVIKKLKTKRKERSGVKIKENTVKKSLTESMFTIGTEQFKLKPKSDTDMKNWIKRL
jgi:hypothetical protein